jgi:hypothetical protein
MAAVCLESVMALPPDTRKALEERLSKIAPRIVDSPDQAVTLIQNLLKQNNVHQSALRIRLQEDETYEDFRDRMARETREMQRWIQLTKEVDGGCKWDVFLRACANKVDLQAKWRPTIIQALHEIGVDDWLFRWHENKGNVPYQWLEKVMAMPDLDPNEYLPRSNYAEVCEPLESTLRGAGKTSNWIAQTLTDFIARFDGKAVTVADVRFPKGQSTKEK